jgi:RNA polymerase sigma factor (sigma-70 family)
VDEVHEFCERVLGDGPAAAGAAKEALASGRSDRVQLLAAAARACRRSAELQAPARPTAAGSEPRAMSEAIAGELAAATASLPERQREALALRELMRLSHQQLATVMGIEPAAVALLLARARLRLRAERRGAPSEETSTCAERERALRTLARRQDSEPLSGEDDEWLLAHLGACAPCSRAHAAMLEASVCYRAWPSARRTAGVPAAQ